MENEIPNIDSRYLDSTGTVNEMDHDLKHRSILTHREREIFELLVLNKNTKEIAEMLFISVKTVRGHISRVMKKLNAKGRSSAIIELIRTGEISNKK
jgi:LuxR family transcriptional regulator, transcriptional regulator of spore coat protein